MKLPYETSFLHFLKFDAVQVWSIHLSVHNFLPLFQSITSYIIQYLLFWHKGPHHHHNRVNLQWNSCLLQAWILWSILDSFRKRLFLAFWADALLELNSSLPRNFWNFAVLTRKTKIVVWVVDHLLVLL